MDRPALGVGLMSKGSLMGRAFWARLGFKRDPDFSREEEE